MRLTWLGALATIATCASLPTTPNLAGIWRLDSAKSTASVSKTIKSLVLEVDQRPERVQVVWLVNDDRGPTVWSEDLVPSTPEAPTPLLRAQATSRLDMTWVLRPSSDRRRAVFSGFAMWTLSADGSILTLGNTALGERLVFHKIAGTVE